MAGHVGGWVTLKSPVPPEVSNYSLLKGDQDWRAWEDSTPLMFLLSTEVNVSMTLCFPNISSFCSLSNRLSVSYEGCINESVDKGGDRKCW